MFDIPTAPPPPVEFQGKDYIDVPWGWLAVCRMKEETGYKVTVLLGSCVMAELSAQIPDGTRVVAYNHFILPTPSSSHKNFDSPQSIQTIEEGTNRFKIWQGEILQFIKGGIETILTLGFSEIPRDQIRARLFGGKSSLNSFSSGYRNMGVLRDELHRFGIKIHSCPQGLNENYSQRFIFDPFTGDYTSTKINTS